MADEADKTGERMEVQEAADIAEIRRKAARNDKTASLPRRIKKVRSKG